MQPQHSHPRRAADSVEGAIRSLRLRDRIVDSCRQPDGELRARNFTDVAKHLFPGAGDDDATEALSAALQLLVMKDPQDPEGRRVLAGNEALPSRLHMFFRNVQGFWACCNPDCSGVSDGYRTEGRRIGKVWERPRVRCHLRSPRAGVAVLPDLR